MIRKLFKIFFIFLCLNTSIAKADDTINWLKTEIDTILNAYKNPDINNAERFDLIEYTINSNFAGAGIAKFVAGKSWIESDKKPKYKRKPYN